MGDSAKAAGGTRKVEIRVMGPGDTIANVATELTTPSSSAREVEALLRSNNALSPACARIDGGLLCTNLEPLDSVALHEWTIGRSQAVHAIRADPSVGRFMREEPGVLDTFGRFAEVCDSSGWCTGSRIAQVSSYMAGGGSAYAFTMERHLGAVAQMADELRVDALTKFGSAASPFQLSQGQSPALGQWLQMNPTYHNLRKSLDDLPRYIRNRMGAIGPPAASPAGIHGRWFRGQFVLPHTGANPGAYVGRVARRLGGQVLRYGKIGTRLTWYVPAVLGVYETATAPRGRRLRTASGQAVGIVMGAVGTVVGGTIIVALVSGPGVVVLVTSIVAGAYLGYEFFDAGKSGGEFLFDWISELDLGPLRRAALTVLR